MTSAKRIHLWEDGTWDQQGGHWMAVRIEEWEEMQDVIASATSLERGIRLGSVTTNRLALLRKRLKALADGRQQSAQYAAAKALAKTLKDDNK